MMFGAHNVEEWSSDEDSGDMDDYDEDDDEYDDDDYFDSEEERERESIMRAAASANVGGNTQNSKGGAKAVPSTTPPIRLPPKANIGTIRSTPIWEPQALNYSPMNLKESIRNEKKDVDVLGSEDQEEDPAELKRKQKNAKKRAEKRRKQKEKKQRETAQKSGGGEGDAEVDDDEDDEDEARYVEGV